MKERMIKCEFCSGRGEWVVLEKDMHQLSNVAYATPQRADGTYWTMQYYGDRPHSWHYRCPSCGGDGTTAPIEHEQNRVGLIGSLLRRISSAL